MFRGGHVAFAVVLSFQKILNIAVEISCFGVAEMGMMCGVSWSELLLCFIPAVLWASGMGEIDTIGAVHIQLYLPVSTFFADEVREGGSFSLSIKSQDLKNW